MTASRRLPAINQTTEWNKSLLHRTSECGQQQFEFDLSRCDSSEPDAQLPFATGKVLLNGPQRPGGGAAVEPRGSGERL
jgi:hypothetical protein